jgi:hypothetical protein
MLRLRMTRRSIVTLVFYMLVRVTDPDREYRRLSPGYLLVLIDWIHDQSVVPAR